MMKLTLNEKYMFSSQMAMTLSAGFSLEQGVKMVYEELDNKDTKQILAGVCSNLEDGMSFSEALDFSASFDDYMVNLIRVGETSGNLDDVMKSLSEYYFKMDDIITKLKQALTYPIILLVMMLVVVGVIVFKVLPIFKGVLEQLGSDLSSFANSFMNFGQIFSFLCFIILAVVVLWIAILCVYQRITHVNILSDFVQKSIFTRKLSRALSKAQVTYAFSLFISSGYDLQEALKFVIALVDDKELKANLELCDQDLKAGEHFVDVIKARHIYQGMQLNMIQVGFKTGQIEEIMKHLSNQLQDEVTLAIDNFLNIIEPTIVTLLSLIVGVILISVMLPLISIMASL